MTKEYRFSKEWPYHISCGGIVYRTKSDGGIEVLVLVQHDGGHDIPKGTLHANETLEHCALREIEEESGQKGEITGYLGGQIIEGKSAKGFDLSKITHYFAVEWMSDTKVHDHEYHDVKWLPAIKAKDILRPSGREVLKRFDSFMQLTSLKSRAKTSYHTTDDEL